MKTPVNLIAALPTSPPATLVNMLLTHPAARAGSETTPAPRTPHPTPSCVDNSDVCHFIFNQTKVVWLAEGGYWLLVKPLRIALIIVLALIARWVISRTVNRLIHHDDRGDAVAVQQVVDTRHENASLPGRALGLSGGNAAHP